VLTKPDFLRVNGDDKGVHKTYGFKVKYHVSQVLGVSSLRITQTWSVYEDARLTLGVFAPSVNETLDLFGF
jgi:hypothetical protein